jgi:hypothetical protein
MGSNLWTTFLFVLPPIDEENIFFVAAISWRSERHNFIFNE